MSSTYKFKGRIEHSAPVIGDSLYLWGGGQLNLPLVHDSPQKRKLTSTVETFSFSSARWSSHLTRGTPPLGVIGYYCTTFRSNIYYYAGYCGHDLCCYNSLNVLNTLTMSWTQLHPNDESMMKKANGGMVSLEFDGTDYLFMVGGMGPTPAVKHPQFQYVYDQMGRVITNEQLLYKLSNGQFTVPSVSGHCCPPNGAFTIDKINQNKGIMVGGASASNVYMFTVTRNTIHWENVTISGEGLWNERLYHASAIINVDSTSPALVVIGGASGIIELTKECLLFDNITTGQFSCKKIPLPNSVTDRYNHSLTAVAMSPNCVWLVIVGGTEGFMNHAPITDTNRLIMIAELVNIEAGEWTVQSVLDGNDLTSKKYQEKYLSYSKTRTWWMDQLIEYPTEKVMKLQRYIQSLHQELQVAHENKVSLQEALTEANKQGSKVDGSQLVIMNEKLEQVLKQKQILTEDNEKLRATVAYNEVYITEIEEEKKQVEEEKRKVEDENKQAKKEKKEAEEEKRQLEEQYLIDKQITKKLKAKVAVNDVYITELEEENEKVEKKYHKEKQITKELKAKVADNELCTAKLLKEKEEWDLTKVTNTKEVQFDYMIPSMDNLECLSDVQVAEFCLVCILGEEWANGGSNCVPIASVNGDTEEGEEEEEQPQQEENDQEEENLQEAIDHWQQEELEDNEHQQVEMEEGDEYKGEDDGSSSDSSSVSKETNSTIGTGGAAKESNNEKNGSKINEGLEPIDEHSSSTKPIPSSSMTEIHSTGVKEATNYAGLVYYEEDGVGDLVTFTAVKKLDALLEFIKKEHPKAKQRPHFYFCIASPDGYIELNLNAQQDEPFTGWSIKPHIKSCRLRQRDIYNFGDKDYPLPPSCLLSVYSSPNAVPTLHYSVPVEGVADPVTLYIQLSRRTTLSTAVAPSSSGNDEDKPVPTKRKREGGFDIKNAKQKIKKVMIENHTDFAGLLQFSLVHVANKLFEVHMIPPEVQQSPTYDAISTCFVNMMSLLDSKSDLEDHCMIFLEALSSVGGPIERVAKRLREKWTAALEGALQFKQSVK
ncbi:PREDICTED: uncharacterized protein LOC109584996 [Amphimedon queenslandica]|uniref:Rab9 effector protein with kelch motifs n=2 Tax=Amphimedon queenslandica TaxID=400682 RepID=A0AAN0JI73_AMPQE|nr:PREDICTED: uncharacterized protein LOC109584996 [Amphimedon queenslandica]|eukprot:XP_019856472.1 PREDICTED: uncharacterized protein LOC109584996 [Amphimedon queenslandica]